MAKRLTPAAIVALKEALCSVYWYKADLRSFVEQSLIHREVVPSINWTAYKRNIVTDLIDLLVSDQNRYLGDLTRLCNDLTTMTSFQHLEQLDEGAQKVRRAKSAVSQLLKVLEPNERITKEKEDSEQRLQRSAEKVKTTNALKERLTLLRRNYMGLVTSTDLQGRGFELEKVMYDLFELFDLDPKASFRNTGEQIDGAFSVFNTEFLFEAKWRKLPSDASDLDAFSSKVRRKLENTLGVFLSINGFTQEAVSIHSIGGSVLILLDGADLMAVLEERIDLNSLLLRKKRHAAQTGEVYLPIHQII